MANKNYILSVTSLFTGALVWGLIWYPYRALEDAGIGGATASLLTYGPGFIAGIFLLRGRLAVFRHRPLLLLAVAASAGWCNLAYVLAALRGEVMTVMLLFYLAPLWTVMFAHWILGERPGVYGYAVVGLALCGALIMLWRPNADFPWPTTVSEWLGLSAGMAFALSNVLSRKLGDVDEMAKSIAVCAGVALVALPVIVFFEDPIQAVATLDARRGWLLAVVAVVILSVNPVVQFGLSHVGANQAIVIFLAEIVVAAIASTLLAAEVISARQWLGGALVVAAALCAGRLAGSNTMPSVRSADNMPAAAPFPVPASSLSSDVPRPPT